MSSKPLPFQPAPIPATDTPPTAVMPVAVAKPKKEVPSTTNKVIGAKIVLQFQGPDGKVYEAETVISSEDNKVQKYSFDIEEKHEKKYEKHEDGTKDLIGFEDTGERILKFQLRYHVR